MILLLLKIHCLYVVMVANYYSWRSYKAVRKWDTHVKEYRLQFPN